MFQLELFDFQRSSGDTRKVFGFHQMGPSWHLQHLPPLIPPPLVPERKPPDITPCHRFVKPQTPHNPNFIIPSLSILCPQCCYQLPPSSQAQQVLSHRSHCLRPVIWTSHTSHQSTGPPPPPSPSHCPPGTRATILFFCVVHLTLSAPK